MGTKVGKSVERFCVTHLFLFKEKLFGIICKARVVVQPAVNNPLCVIISTKSFFKEFYSYSLGKNNGRYSIWLFLPICSHYQLGSDRFSKILV